MKTKRIIISVIFVSLICLQCMINGAFSAIPEPESVIYGEVFNTYQLNKVPVTQGNIQWTIRQKGSDQTLSYETQIQCLTCSEYENGDCVTCEKYSYVLPVPQETAVDFIDQMTANTVGLTDDNEQYDHVSVNVDKKPAKLVIRSQFGNSQEDEKQGKFILASQARRSHYYRVDLEVVMESVDTDEDDLPDFWEKQYQLDTASKSDADLDSDNDGWSNLDEFTNGTNPLVSNKEPSLLSDELLIFEGGKTLFLLDIADSDTQDTNLYIRFKNIPESIQLVFHGNDAPYEHGHKIATGDTISLRHILSGNVLLESTDVTTETTRIYLELIDGDHDPVYKALSLKTFLPTPTDGTDALCWMDAFYGSKQSESGVRLDD